MKRDFSRLLIGTCLRRSLVNHGQRIKDSPSSEELYIHFHDDETTFF